VGRGRGEDVATVLKKGGRRSVERSGSLSKKRHEDSFIPKRRLGKGRRGPMMVPIKKGKGEGARVRRGGRSRKDEEGNNATGGGGGGLRRRAWRLGSLQEMKRSAKKKKPRRIFYE